MIFFKNLSVNFFLAVLSSFLLTASFPDIDCSVFIWFAQVPLFFALRTLSFSDAFRIGFLTGIVHYLTLIYWVIHSIKNYGHIPLILCIGILFLLCAYLALYFGVFALIFVKLRQKPIVSLFLLPVSWVSLEYIRTFFLSGFPWGLFGYTQFKILNIIQIADIAGVYGISFIIVLTNVVIFNIYLYIKTKNCKKQSISLSACLISFVSLILILFFVLGYGKWRILKTDKEVKTSEFAKVAVIQGNIDQSEKWDTKKQMIITKKYIALSDSVKKIAPDLIVWPETATPFYLIHNVFMTKILMDGIVKHKSMFLIGSPSASKTNQQSSFNYYNSAYLIHSDGYIAGKYDKVHLVPFGEYVPFKKWLPFLGKMVQQIGDFTPGNIENILNCEKFTIGVQICYEIIFPQLSRSMVKNNALFIVNITNDAWFGNTSAPYQHFAMAVLRAVENKKTLIRAANTGISGYIDPVGRVLESSSIYQEKVLVQKVPVLKTKTFYTKYGDIFALSCLVLTFCSLIIIFTKMYLNKINIKNKKIRIKKIRR